MTNILCCKDIQKKQVLYYFIWLLEYVIIVCFGNVRGVLGTYVHVLMSVGMCLSVSGTCDCL